MNGVGKYLGSFLYRIKYVACMTVILCSFWFGTSVPPWSLHPRHNFFDGGAYESALGHNSLVFCLHPAAEKVGFMLYGQQ